MPTTIFRSLAICVVLSLTVPGSAQAAEETRRIRSLPVNTQHMIILIKTSVIAVNHASRTRDYSVLRALATPGFRAKHSRTDLERTFAGLRKANLDLGPIVLYRPKFTRSPGVTPNGLLWLTGYFPTRPWRLDFDMIFQAVDGEWRLHRISLRPSKASKVAASR